MPGLVQVMTLEELPQNGFKAVEVEGRSILVGRIHNQLFAWLDRCPHAGAPLRVGKRLGEELTCGRHGWTFNLLTGSGVPDPTLHLTSIPVQIDGSQVFVSV